MEKRTNRERFMAGEVFRINKIREVAAHFSYEEEKKEILMVQDGKKIDVQCKVVNIEASCVEYERRTGSTISLGLLLYDQMIFSEKRLPMQSSKIRTT